MADHISLDTEISEVGISAPAGEDPQAPPAVARGAAALLIEEASRQFTQRGYAATTVKDLSAATGVAISVLYNHFPSKADLLREAVLLPFVDLVDSIGATWAALQDEPGKEAQLIRSFIAGLYDGLFEHRGALLTLIAAQAELEESLRNEIARGRCAGCSSSCARSARRGAPGAGTLRAHRHRDQADRHPGGRGGGAGGAVPA